MGRHRHRHRRRRNHLRSGLVGASAALAVSAVAVGTGLLPNAGDAHLDDAGGLAPVPRDTLSPTASPTATPPEPDGRATEQEPAPEQETTAGQPSSPGTEESSPPQDAGEPPAESPASPAGPEPTAEPGGQEPEPEQAPTQEETVTPRSDPETAAALQVLSLVNEERGQAGCRPLTLDAQLSALAQDFSEDMAERGFFDHTDPDGRTPWDRAQAAGVGNLGGENVARGQQDAEAVMAAWMDSEGHRANILNCEFRTLGVGVHFGTGGPWWTQDFGY